MMTRKQSRKSPASITQVVGSSLPLLPGELREQYQQALDATIEELQARTPLQSYLAQKIFDCLWWIMRYEQLKVETILVTMAKRVTDFHRGDGLSEEQAHIVRALRNNDWNDRLLKDHMREWNHSPETLLQEATSQLVSRLVVIDQQIALRSKTLSGLQSSYEALVNRRVQAERLRLQTELLRRDLTAIDVPAIEAGRSTKG